MAFGFKMKSVKTQKEYTLEELYEQIKDKEFTAGKPDYTKHGMTYVITFPPLDRNNQVWIIPGQMSKGPYSKWTIQKSSAAGMDNMIGNMVLDKLTDGWSSASGVFGKKAKNIEQLVEATAKELDALGL